MKILVLSDTHGRIDMLKYVLNNASYDEIFYLGDGLTDIMQCAIDPAMKITYVRGNQDGDIDAPDDLMFELKGIRIMMTHGHNHGVKLGMGKLFKHAIANEVDLLLFGHTHMPFTTTLENGMVVLNPGSLGKGRLKYNSFGIIEIDDTGKFTTRLFSFNM